MKTLLLIAVAISAIAVRILVWLPWGTRDPGTKVPARFNFLLGFGLIAMAILLFCFWFAMRAR